MKQIGFKARLGLACGTVAAISSPLHADVTATFAGEGPQRMVVEVADDGSARIDTSNGGRLESGYTLIRDGMTYQVSPGPGHPTAISAEAQRYLFDASVRRGEIILSSDRKKKLKPISFEPAETVQIAGFTGRRYKMPKDRGPGFVLSDEPRLKPLGIAMGRFLAGVGGAEPDGEAFTSAILPLLSEHGVLSFAGQDLAAVKFDAIDHARFALPAKVVTLNDVKEDDAPPSAQADVRRPPIVQGAYRDHVLYLLDGAGAVQTWAEGAKQGNPFAAPGTVASFCLTADTFWTLTVDPKTLVARLWSRTNSHNSVTVDPPWLKVGEFPQSEENAVVAIDCSGIEPVVVSTQRLTMPISGRSVDLSERLPPPRGYVVSQVQGGVLWLGFNSGEWGGGLKRISLADGKVDEPTDVDPKNLCGGTLNPACDPVTGLAPDPLRSDCMLATIGLVHMLSHGSVVRICGNDVSLAYAKPYTLDPDWHWDGKLDRERTSSVAFQSMRSEAGNGTAWAVASDGIYRFDAEQLPQFTPFPMRRLGDAVDWSHPKYVLIPTDMNQRHSLSGKSFILVPR